MAPGAPMPLPPSRLPANDLNESRPQITQLPIEKGPENRALSIADIQHQDGLREAMLAVLNALNY